MDGLDATQVCWALLPLGVKTIDPLRLAEDEQTLMSGNFSTCEYISLASMSVDP
jgi:hypothetical protein